MTTNKEINFFQIPEWSSPSIQQYRKELDSILITSETVSQNQTEILFALIEQTEQFFEVHQNPFVKENKKELIPLILNKLFNFLYYLPTIQLSNQNDEVVSIKPENMDGVVELSKRIYLMSPIFPNVSSFCFPVSLKVALKVVTYLFANSLR